MIAKNTIFIISVFFLNSMSFGQEDVRLVTLVSNLQNKAHPFYEVLSKKEPRYINWLYFHCKGQVDTNSLIVPMNSPLIFSVKHEGLVVSDTVANCVHPKLYEDERELEWQSEIPRYGSLPEDVNIHLRNDPNTSARIDLLVQREIAIKMYVLSQEGDLVSTISDQTLKKGKHRLEWNTADIKAGNYLLFTEIDSYLSIHELHVEKNWWENLFSREKEVVRRKRVIRISYENLEMPELNKEHAYISENRFGTSFGLHLLKTSMVKIKLYAINGDFISTIHHKQLNAGEAEFLLDEYVEKAGSYFIQYSINNKRKHLKLKIKK